MIAKDKDKDKEVTHDPQSVIAKDKDKEVTHDLQSVIAKDKDKEVTHDPQSVIARQPSVLRLNVQRKTNLLLFAFRAVGFFKCPSFSIDEDISYIAKQEVSDQSSVVCVFILAGVA